MRRLPILPTLPLPAAPRQLSMSFDAAKLRGMNPTERSTALSRLAVVLLEAANVAVKEDGDDGR